jgi:hypothetical protein
MRRITPELQPDARPLRDAGFLWGKPLYRVEVEWEWEYGDILVLARRHYQFDGASVPRLCWGAMGYTPDGLHRAAALGHDIGCEREGMLMTGAAVGRPEYKRVLLGDTSVRITQSTVAGQMTSAEVHQMFRDVLDATDGGRASKHRLFHFAVRTFGPRWRTTYA